MFVISQFNYFKALKRFLFGLFWNILPTSNFCTLSVNFFSRILTDILIDISTSNFVCIYHEIQKDLLFYHCADCLFML